MKKFFPFLKRHKWSLLLVVISLFVAGFVIYDNFSASTGILPEILIKKDTKVDAPLSGLKVEKSVAEKTPTSVVIENHPDARPQSGLNEADLVYETFAEGGITRFLVFYQSKEAPKEIGPVRSARPYFVEWAKSYNALFAHVGQSYDAVATIRNSGVYDLNQFSFGSYFWRDRSRYAPHNVYTTLAKLSAAAKTKGYPAKNTNVPSFQFKKEAKTEERGAASSFRIGFNNLFAVTYNYNPTENSYFRSMLGVKQTDRTTKAQIRAKNVVVCFTDISYGINVSNKQKVNIRTTGTGTAVIFQDGKKITGTWRRTSATITRFYDADGKEVKLNPGTTWVEFVPKGTSVR